MNGILNIAVQKGSTKKVMLILSNVCKSQGLSLPFHLYVNNNIYLTKKYMN